MRTLEFIKRASVAKPATNGSPGVFTSDLDIPIRSSSFQYAIPPFAYPNNPGFNGGLSLGLAFLSDIQVFMFMEAAQGDRRTNVMQAPKLTLFNGQTATITVSDQQFFVTAVTVTGFGGQIVFTPTNTPIPTNTAGKVTGGGMSNVTGGIANFGFIVESNTSGAVSGDLQYVNHASGAKVHSVSFSSLVICTLIRRRSCGASVSWRKSRR